MRGGTDLVQNIPCAQNTPVSQNTPDAKSVPDMDRLHCNIPCAHLISSKTLSVDKT